MFFSDILNNSNTISETLEIKLQNDNLTLRNAYNGQRIGEVERLCYGQPQSLLSLMTSEEMDLERQHFTNNRTIFFIQFGPCAYHPDSYPVAIYEFQRESGLDQVICAGSCGKRRKKNSTSRYFPFDPSHDISRALIQPSIQSSFPQKHVNSDWVRVCLASVARYAGEN